MNSLFKNLIIIALLNSLGGYTSQAQKKNSMKDSKSNPLLCDPETGVCEIDTTSTTGDFDYQFQQKKLIKIIYFTDPICSSCWGIEPQLRKLKLEYGKYLEIEYRMGGLLPDWSNNFKWACCYKQIVSQCPYSCPNYGRFCLGFCNQFLSALLFDLIGQKNQSNDQPVY